MTVIGLQKERLSIEPLGTKSLTLEFAAKLLRSAQVLGQGLLFETGGATDGISLMLNHRFELILSLCMEYEQQSKYNRKRRPVSLHDACL